MLPLYAQLLGVHDRGVEHAWCGEGDSAGAVANLEMPSVRREGLRPGSAAWQMDSLIREIRKVSNCFPKFGICKQYKVGLTDFVLFRPLHNLILSRLILARGFAIIRNT